MSTIDALVALCRPGVPDVRERLHVLGDALLERGDPRGRTLIDLLADPWLRAIGIESFGAPHEHAPLRFDVPVFELAPFAAAIGLASGGRAVDAEFVLLPPLGVDGPFRWGRPDDGAPFDPRDEAPPATAQPAPFLIARTALSQRVYQGAFSARVVDDVTAFTFEGSTDAAAWASDPLEPVHWITLKKAYACCKELALALPSEAEWELAASGGAMTAFWCGERLDPRFGRVDSSQPGHVSSTAPPPRAFAPVGSLPPNAFGLHEVHGNVAEWVADVHPELAWDSGGVCDGPLLETEASCGAVLKGGCYLDAARHCRRFSRSVGESLLQRGHHLGLRPLYRWRALGTLRAGLDPRERIERVVGALGEQDGAVSAAGVHAKLGEDVVGHLLALIGKRRRRRARPAGSAPRRRARYTAAALAVDRALAVLAELPSVPESVLPVAIQLHDLGYRATTLLVRFGRRVEERFLARLGDADEGVRADAAFALARMRSTRAVDPLLAGLGTPGSGDYREFADALARIVAGAAYDGRPRITAAAPRDWIGGGPDADTRRRIVERFLADASVAADDMDALRALFDMAEGCVPELLAVLDGAIAARAWDRARQVSTFAPLDVPGMAQRIVAALEPAAPADREPLLAVRSETWRHRGAAVWPRAADERALRRCLDDPDLAVRSDAALSLLALGVAVDPAIASAVMAGTAPAVDSHMRDACFAACVEHELPLHELPRERLAPLLCAARREDGGFERVVAALARTSHARALLQPLLDSAALDARLAGARAALTLDRTDRDALRVLRAVFEDANALEGWQLDETLDAALALIAAGEQVAAWPLAIALLQRNATQRAADIEALVRALPPHPSWSYALATFVRAVGVEVDLETRLVAARCVARSLDPPGLGLLAPERCRGASAAAIAHGLGRLGPAAAAHAGWLESALRDPDDDVRVCAAEALVAIRADGDATIVTALAGGLGRDSPHHRVQFAAAGLVRLGPRAHAARAALVAAHERADSHVRAVLQRAIDAVGLPT